MIDWGLPPTSIVAAGVPVVASIRVTVPSPLLATHTEPSPTASPFGESPTGMVAVTAAVVGSMRTTASSSLSTTQTAAVADRDRAWAMPDGDRRGKASGVDAGDGIGLVVGHPHGVATEVDSCGSRCWGQPV